MFDGCNKLRSIKFENGSSLSSIQAHGLEGLNNLTSIDFGDAIITNIDNFAFRFCYSLTSLKLTEGLTYIGRFAFYGCESLTSLQMPSTLEYIGRYAFYECNNLELYFVSETLPLYTQDYWDHSIKGYYLGVKEVKQNEEFKYAILQNDNIAIIEYLGLNSIIDLTNVSLGGNIITIGSNSFKYKQIDKIILPDTIQTIGSNAFYCSNLANINFVDSITYIGSNAFFNTKLENVIFSNNSNLKKIDNNAFAYCDELVNVTLPSTLTSLGDYAFYKSGIINLKLNKEMPLEAISKYAFEFSHIKKVTLPNNVTEIKDNAFANIRELETIEFNNQELYLMSNAFYNTGIKDLTIPENIVYIGEYSLISLFNLTEYKVSENNPYYKAIDGVLYSKNGKRIIAYPAGKNSIYKMPSIVETIGFGAFENSKVSYIDFTENKLLSTIGYRAFFRCNNLETILIPSNVVSIDYYAFAYCDNLKEVIFEENSKLYGVYEGAFYSCKNLNKIVLPDEVLEIGDYCFYGCLSLTTIPVSNTSKLLFISSRALSNTGIKELKLQETIIEIGDYAFSGSKVQKVDLTNSKKDELYLGIGIFEDCVELKEITLAFIGRYYEDEEITWFGYIFGAGSFEANNTYVPESLKEVTIEEGITFIGTGGFYGLKNIDRVNIPDSVNKIYKYSFRKATFKYKLENEVIFVYKNDYNEEIIETKLSSDSTQFESNNDYIGKGIEKININKYVENIGSGTFYNCSSLTSIVIPESVTSIGDNAFYNCSSLSSIVIPEGVTSIGFYAFYNCSSLTSIVIPKGVTSIGFYAFYGCSSLTSIVIPDGVTSIGYSAFSGCTSLTSIVIPDGVTSIGESTFSHCSSLSSIVIPEGVTSIGFYAFYGCSSLTSITIPEGVTSIGYHTFSECTSLTSVYCNGTIENWCNIKFESYESNPMSYATHFYMKNSNNEYEEVTKLVIPNTITSISDYGFRNFTAVKEVIIPESVTTIGECAFIDCSSLKIVEISKGLEKIGNYAFSGCNNLLTIINNSDLEITFSRFGNGEISANALKIINKDNSIIYNVTSILSNIKTYFETEDNFLFIVNSYDSYQLVAYLGLDETVTLPTDINGNSYVIYKMKGVKNVIIPNTFTAIHYNAFWGCTSLTSIVIPEGVRTIGESAFSYCSILKNVIFEKNSLLTTISREAFKSTNITSIELPEKLTNIETDAFAGCTKLSNIVNNSKLELTIGSKDNGCVAYYANKIIDSDGNIIYADKTLVINENKNSIGYNDLGNHAFTNIIIPKNITYIGYNAFNDCNLLDNVYYNGTIEDWCNIKFASYDSNPMSYATHFYLRDNNGDYHEVTEIVLPDSITELSSYKFINFTALKKFTFSDSVISIGYEIFDGCLNLENIYYNGILEDWLKVSFDGILFDLYIKNNDGEYIDIKKNFRDNHIRSIN